LDNRKCRYYLVKWKKGENPTRSSLSLWSSLLFGSNQPFCKSRYIWSS